MNEDKNEPRQIQQQNKDEGRVNINSEMLKELNIIHDRISSTWALENKRWMRAFYIQIVLFFIATFSLTVSVISILSLIGFFEGM